MGRRPKRSLLEGEGKHASPSAQREDILSEAMESSPVNSLILSVTARESQLKKKAWTSEPANSSKLQKHCSGEVRRSVRRRNAVISSAIQLPDSEPLTANDDGNEEALELHKEGHVVLLPSTAEKNLEAKIDVLEKQIETLQSSMNALQSKELNSCACPFNPDVDNRTLHLGCLKKINELMTANDDLTSKLDDARKVEMNGKRQQLLGDFLDKLKNTILLFELSRAAE